MSTKIILGKCFLLLMIVCALLVIFPMQNSYAGASVETPNISSISSVNGTDIKVKWSTITGAAGYRLYRSTSEKGTYTQIKALSGTSFTDTGLTSGTLYYYKVRAYKKIDSTNVYSNYSGFKTCVPLPVPAFESVVSASNTEIKLAWNAVSGATGYKLYRSTSQNGTYTLIKTVTTTSFKDTGLTEGKVYYYKIRAYKTFKSGTYSSAYSQYKAAMSLTTPIITKAISTSDTEISITWKAISGATGYSIYRSSSANGTYSFIKKTGATNYTNTGLKANTTYYYKIRCYKTINDISFNSYYSSYKAGKTLLPASTLGISNATTPSGSLNLGSSFTLRGDVSSNYTITSLTAGVYDSAGNATSEVKTVAPGAKSYNLSAIDADIHFNYLPVGSGYEYRVTSSDASGKTMTLLSSKFNIVTDSTLSISGETKPAGNLVLGSSFGIRGIIVSNYNIVSVRATVYTAAGSVTSEDCTVTPNAKTYDLKGTINNSIIFDHLPAGDYVYKVWAKDASGYERTLVESSFSIIVADSLFTTSQIDSICASYSFINGYYWSYNTSTGSPTAYTATTHKANTTTSSGKVPPRPGEAGYNGYRFDDGAECYAFAGFIGYKLSGVLNPYTGWAKYTRVAAVVNAGGLKIGDIIRAGGHSVVVYKIIGNSVKFIECWGGSNNKISVNGYFNGDGTTDSLDKIASKYGLQFVLRYVK